MEDQELLREYANQNSEEAFQELVNRHMNLVYSVALRQVHDPHLAQDVVQAVFIALAQKTHQLSPATILEGWLFQATRFAAMKVVRTEHRRQHWIQEAARMENPINEPTPEDAWTQIVPVLNETISELRETDRNAILLRFFKGQSFSAVGAGLGLSEDAAKKRVTRALEKLRTLLGRRGVVLPAAILVATLSSNAAPAAPVGLSATVAAAAAAKGVTATTSTLTLTKGILKLMAWTKVKMATVTAVLLAGLATTTLVVHHEIKIRSQDAAPGTNYWTKDSLADAGYQTPQAALKTMLWAMSRGDLDAFLASATPELKADMEKEFGTKPGGQFSSQAKQRFNQVTGFRITDQTTAAANLTVLTVYIEGENKTEKMTFKKIEGDWKLAK